MKASKLCRVLAARCLADPTFGDGRATFMAQSPRITPSGIPTGREPGTDVKAAILTREAGLWTERSRPHSSLSDWLIVIYSFLLSE